MESVLVGVDHSESSRRALRFALERARVNSWHVSVVHVINWSPYTAPTLEENDYRPSGASGRPPGREQRSSTR